MLGALLLVTVAAYASIGQASWAYEDATTRVSPIGWRIPGRPLTIWSLRDTTPERAHLVSLGVHLVNGGLIYGLGATLANPATGLVAAAILLWHPLASEGVAYLSARGDLLLTSFTLLAIWLAVTWTDRGGVWRLLGCLIALTGAALSKEIGLLAGPLVMWTLFGWRRDRPATRLLLTGLLVLGAGVLIVQLPLIQSVLHLIPSSGGSVHRGSAFVVWQLTAWWRLLLLVPFPLGFSVDHDVLGLADWRPVAVVASGALVGAIVWLGSRGSPRVAWALGWPLVALAPRLVFQANEWVREYQLYLTLSGIALGLALWIVPQRSPA